MFDEELGVCHAAVFCFYSQLMLVMSRCMSCCSFLFVFPADVGDEELGVCHAAVFYFYSKLMLVMRS